MSDPIRERLDALEVEYAGRVPLYNPPSNAAIVLSLVSAVTAVLDLHQQDIDPHGLSGECTSCHIAEWPCETYKAIADALGVETDR
jgi:hypothetical protein